ncbi:MAGUK p55 subfamily member 4 [Varanus komodoensis]|nr:MAGUK p55 subfamily member 4 [Varanus komodoensis]
MNLRIHNKKEEEFSGSGQQVFITGFRRSMRLCRRKTHNSHLPCYARCPSGCYSAVAAPYEEVVRYQRLPGDRNRLIVLGGLLFTALPQGEKYLELGMGCVFAGQRKNLEPLHVISSGVVAFFSPRTKIHLGDELESLIPVKIKSFPSSHSSHALKSVTHCGVLIQYLDVPFLKHSGPSGVGVNELRRRLIEINPHHFQSAVPHTTRVQKSYEENGREYHYVPRETFENMVYTHRMLEHGEYKGNLYGTSIDAVRAILDEGKICIVDLEPQNIQLARTHELKPYIIFVKPSSMSCMKQSRKNARIITDYYVNMKFKEEDLQEMEESAKKMETQFGQFFDHVIVNDDLQEACMQLLTAVRRAQDEPQWVPATWICSDHQP